MNIDLKSPFNRSSEIDPGRLLFQGVPSYLKFKKYTLYTIIYKNKRNDLSIDLSYANSVIFVTFEIEHLIRNCCFVIMYVMLLCCCCFVVVALFIVYISY